MKKKLSGFELGRRQSVNKLREMMRYSYDKFTGKIVNQNGDVAKSMDEAIRLNEKIKVYVCLGNTLTVPLFSTLSN